MIITSLGGVGTTRRQGQVSSFRHKLVTNTHVSTSHTSVVLTRMWLVFVLLNIWKLVNDGVNANQEVSGIYTT